MINQEMVVKSPRGTFKIHTIFDNKEEANKNGWGLWFANGEWDIYTKDNRVGAVVKNKHYN